MNAPNPGNPADPANILGVGKPAAPIPTVGAVHALHQILRDEYGRHYMDDAPQVLAALADRGWVLTAEADGSEDPGAHALRAAADEWDRLNAGPKFTELEALGREYRPGLKRRVHLAQASRRRDRRRAVMATVDLGALIHGATGCGYALTAVVRRANSPRHCDSRTHGCAKRIPRGALYVWGTCFPGHIANDGTQPWSQSQCEPCARWFAGNGANPHLVPLFAAPADVIEGN